MAAQGRTAVLVCLDLHGVPAQKKFRTYTRIKNDLEKLKVKKTVITKSGNEIRLTYNTYLGYLPAKFAANQSMANLRDLVRKKVVEVVKRHHAAATVFVFIARDWGWGRRRFHGKKH
jgi:hypothetical protein